MAGPFSRLPSETIELVEKDPTEKLVISSVSLLARELMVALNFYCVGYFMERNLNYLTGIQVLVSVVTVVVHLWRRALEKEKETKLTAEEEYSKLRDCDA